MSDHDHAHDLLAMAYGDLRALRGMLKGNAEDADDSYFSDEIYGFHAQQSAEKILKARIASLGGYYAKTHDLMALLNLLADLGDDVSNLMDLVDLNLFAVQYRYESFDTDDEELDRETLLATLESLFAKMKAKIG